MPLALLQHVEEDSVAGGDIPADIIHMAQPQHVDEDFSEEDMFI